MASRLGILSFPFAALGLVGVLSPACSSSTDRPAELGACEPTGGELCPGAPIGRTSPLPDAGMPGLADAGVAVGTDAAGGCAGAFTIFSQAGSSCAQCVAANCCQSPTACPNDPACTSVAVCIAQTCLQNDPACFSTCVGATPPVTSTAYLNFRQCVGASCVGCPALASGTI